MTLLTQELAHFNREHTCTSIGCNVSFTSDEDEARPSYLRKALTKPIVNAHTKLYLHAKTMHGVRIDFGCHARCRYIDVK